VALGYDTGDRFLSEQAAIGIEGDKNMVERAKLNALRNNLTNTEFYYSNLFEPAVGATWMQTTYDKILLDPPRTGAIEIISTFPQLKPKRIVYVSCNPATLARDAGELVNNQGFRLVKAGVMDMFPHTKDVESIALFVRE
jgi:23S rRNA (uracil1939-C5)-methyltransferase